MRRALGIDPGLILLVDRSNSVAIGAKRDISTPRFQNRIGEDTPQCRQWGSKDMSNQEIDRQVGAGRGKEAENGAPQRIVFRVMPQGWQSWRRQILPGC
jgi:hypothetical protein